MKSQNTRHANLFPVARSLIEFLFLHADKIKAAQSHLPASASRNQSATVRSPQASHVKFPSHSWMFCNPPNVSTAWLIMSRYTKCPSCCPQSPMSVCCVLNMLTGVTCMLWCKKNHNTLLRFPNVPLMWSACGRMHHQLSSLVSLFFHNNCHFLGVILGSYIVCRVSGSPALQRCIIMVVEEL